MPLQPPTRNFLIYLKQNKAVRDQIKAEPNKTLLYAGDFGSPIWVQLETYKRNHPGAIQLLPDVLRSIPAPPGSRGTLKDYVDDLTRQVSSRDQLVIWKALSGIFASNAQGTVYFSVGSHVNPATKVFASTEVHVLLRNPKISSDSRQLVEYYRRCVLGRTFDINTGFMPGDF